MFTPTPELFAAWTFNLEGNREQEVRLVATNKDTGAVVHGFWIPERGMTPYIMADLLVSNAKGYVDAHQGAARHVLNTQLSILTARTESKE